VTPHGANWRPKTKVPAPSLCPADLPPPAVTQVSAGCYAQPNHPRFWGRVNGSDPAAARGPAAPRPTTPRTPVPSAFRGPALSTQLGSPQPSQLPGAKPAWGLLGLILINRARDQRRPIRASCPAGKARRGAGQRLGAQRGHGRCRAAPPNPPKAASRRRSQRAGFATACAELPRNPVPEPGRWGRGPRGHGAGAGLGSRLRQRRCRRGSRARRASASQQQLRRRARPRPRARGAPALAGGHWFQPQQPHTPQNEPPGARLHVPNPAPWEDSASLCLTWSEPVLRSRAEHGDKDPCPGVAQRPLSGFCYRRRLKEAGKAAAGGGATRCWERGALSPRSWRNISLSWANTQSRMLRAGMGRSQQEWDALGRSGMLPAGVGCPGQEWDVLGRSGMLQARAGCSQQEQEALGRSRMLPAGVGCSGQEQDAPSRSGMPWAGVGCSGQEWDAPSRNRRPWAGAGCSQQEWDVLGRSGMLRAGMGYSGQERDALGRSGMPWAGAGCPEPRPEVPAPQGDPVTPSPSASGAAGAGLCHCCHAALTASLGPVPPASSRLTRIGPAAWLAFLTLPVTVTSLPSSSSSSAPHARRAGSLLPGRARTWHPLRALCPLAHAAPAPWRVPSPGAPRAFSSLRGPRGTRGTAAGPAPLHPPHKAPGGACRDPDPVRSRLGP